MKPIDRAIGATGSVVDLAARIGVSIQAVYLWRSGKRSIPADRCPSIERATGGVVTCEELRPDVEWAVVRGTAPATATEGA